MISTVGESHERRGEAGDSPVLVIDSVSKRFGAVQALAQVSLDCHPGEIHAVLGENGSGKSTLFGIASGVLAPDTGRVVIGGEELAAGHADRARQRGLSMAYQTYSLVSELTVAHNLLLSMPQAERPRHLSSATGWAAAELGRLGVDVDPRSLVGDMPLAKRQLLEIVKAIVARPRVLLLDEPTTALGPDEVRHVHRLVSEAVAAGVGVLYVSHRLPEILAIADRLTVLRDGERIATFAADAFSEEEIVALMIGRPVELAFPERADVADASIPRLSVRGLRSDRFGPIDLDVGRGEILGLAGAEGNGQAQILRALAGVEAATGDVLVDGSRATPSSPAAALRRRIMLLSGERLRESLFPVLGVRANATVGTLRKVSRFGFVIRRRETQAATHVVSELSVRTPSTEHPVRFLSGGNQQKVVLGRPLLGDVEVLLAEEPTQGVDVASRFDIYDALRERSRAGMSVIVRSADPIELAGICDRVLIVSRGRVVGELGATGLSEDRIVDGIVRAESRSAAEEAARDSGSAEFVGDGQTARLAPDGDDPDASTKSVAVPVFERPWLPVVTLALLSIVVGLYTWQRSDAFLTEFNLNSLLLLTVPLALASIGQLNVLLLGQFDISIGALMGLTVVCASFLVTDPAWSWILLGTLGLLAIAASVGVLNVVLVRWLSIPSIIATIATLSVLRGITLMLRPTPEGLISSTLIEGLTASWGFVPYSFVGVVALAILADLWLYRSRSGLTTRAVGFDVVAATRMGVASQFHYVRAFILASVFAGAGGLFLAALVAIGDPRLGTSFTLPTLAAAVLGGAALGGGRGSFIGAVNGALFLTLIINVLPFLGWSAAWGDVARGAVTLGALALLRGSELARLIRRARRTAVRSPSSRPSPARRPLPDELGAGAAHVASGDDAAVPIVREVVPGPVQEHVGPVAEPDQVEQVQPEPGEPAE